MIRLLTVVILIVPVALFAQQQDISAHVFSLDQDIPKLYVASQEQGPRAEVTLHPRRRMPLPGDSWNANSRVLFYATAQPQPDEVPLVQMTLNGGVQQPLIVLYKDNRNPNDNLHVVLLEDGPQAMPRDSATLVNLTGVELLALVGEKRFKLPPGAGPSVRTLAFQDRRTTTQFRIYDEKDTSSYHEEEVVLENSSLPVALAARNQGKLVPIYNSPILVNEGYRYLIFVRAPPKSTPNRVDTTILAEFLPPPRE